MGDFDCGVADCVVTDCGGCEDCNYANCDCRDCECFDTWLCCTLDICCTDNDSVSLPPIEVPFATQPIVPITTQPGYMPVPIIESDVAAVNTTRPLASALIFKTQPRKNKERMVTIIKQRNVERNARKRRIDALIEDILHRRTNNNRPSQSTDPMETNDSSI